MKAKMISIMVMFCVLLAFHEEMGVEAGKWKYIRNMHEQMIKCCAKIRCFDPHRCYSIFAFTNCFCSSKKQTFNLNIDDYDI